MYRGKDGLDDILDDINEDSEFWTEIPDIDTYTAEQVENTRKRLQEIGVHSIWVYDPLPSARISRALIYDPFHAFANLCKDLIAILKERSRHGTPYH